ncbi:hypothetical protein C7H19_24795 [Aphanothece hegewaldii CCALA 016]|uniref:Actin-like protein N-terminal domain-containing protein n=1 Tax=Aphanothece hegewaldii CCALA 016 TaxID=2107694 RepID=A0A2T1LQH3_9CHRO|nr:hypothetical protein [Aphanothece hegewaldii]PSF28137.1 hypothetical protein C7H19_24795 [Aphanothece hegewaldii CCALA 016]
MKVHLGIDVGTSMIKVLYGVSDRELEYIALSPEVMAVDASLITEMLTLSGSDFVKPEHQAIVRLEKGLDGFFVGRMAQDLRVNVAMKPLKSSSLIPKILAATGVIAHRLNCWSFSVSLLLLLPLSEDLEATRIVRQLKAIQQFYFRDKLCKISWTAIKCYPEGLGLLLGERKQSGTLIGFQFGYRNTSLLVLEDGSLNRSKSSTTMYGFHDCLDKIAYRIPGCDRELLQNAIITSSKMNYDGKQWQNKSYSHLALRDAHLNEYHHKILDEAWSSGLKLYWQLLEQSWLKDRLPSSVERVVIGGGASVFISQYLNEYLRSVVPGVMCDSWSHALAVELPPFKNDQRATEQNFSLRFLDLWFLMHLNRTAIK